MVWIEHMVYTLQVEQYNNLLYIRSWHWNYYSNHLYINKSALLVKILYNPVRTLHAKCWPFKYWWSDLSSKVCKKIHVRSWWNSCVHATVCMHLCVCVFTQCAKSGLYACTLHAKSGLPTKNRHTRCLLLVLASDSDSSSLKMQELTIKWWGSLSLPLALNLFLETF